MHFKLIISIVPKMTKKEFLKKYSDSLQNQHGAGVWSGRGIGIPVGGAIGGGDDYKQKIGKGKLPDFRTGRPTQGADSTFSSYLARVNTGYDDYDKSVEYISMFPEQEAEDYDIYSWEDTIRSRKIPKDFKIMRPRLKGIRESDFLSDDMQVKNSQYSLKKLFREEAGVEDVAVDFSAPRFKDIVTDVLGDAIFYVADKLSIDVSGVVVLLPVVAFNLWQIRSSTTEGEELLEKFRAEPTKELAIELDGLMSDITRDVVDLVQRLIEAFPFPSPFGEEDISFITGQLVTYGASSSLRSGSEMYKDLLDKVPDPVRMVLEWMPTDPTPTGVGIGIMKGVVSQGLSMVGEIHKEIREYKESLQMGQPTSGVDASEEEKEQEMKGITKADLYRAILTGDESAIRENAEKIKAVINESIYPDHGTYRPVFPQGYEYRDVPTIVSKNEEDQQFETLENYEDFAVAYKTDAGVVSYQDRNKQVSESALRRIIRQDIEVMLDESKKKE